ncbi:MAG: hypothetical protein CMO06_07375 [Thalassospira sp.]|uniref:hypothetical protein n=1 Tax=Thalassospira sp. TaxID=1912094 RepID=UPI000C3D4FFB|nr:hypothetical protein [Thalassospira sp.]MAZ32952.1 hypothetical protein [Thalassospira sp.]
MRNLFVATLLLGTSLTMLQADAQEAETAAPNDMATAPVTANDLYREMRIQAGQYAARNRHQVLVGDFTCDDINDQIVGWVDRDNPEGPFFDVLMVTNHKGQAHSELKQIPFAQSEQYALCIDDKTAPPVMSWQVNDPEYMRDVIGNGDLCNIAVRVDDFMCDAPQFFWSEKPGESGEHWMFFRN